MEGVGGLFFIVYLGIVIWIAYWLYITVPAGMARKRRRDPTAWVLIAILGSPFLAIFLLLVLGDAD